MPSFLRDSSSPSTPAPDQNRAARPVVSTHPPFVNETPSPESVVSSPALREKQERVQIGQNRPSPKAVGPALWASVPALLLLGLGAAMRDNSLPRPLAGGDFEATGKRGGDALVVADQSAFISQSQTMVVPTATSPAPVVWQARLLAGRGVTGHAPIDGQITRVYVREGQNVEVGDRVLRIASSRQVMTETVEDVPAPSRFTRRAERAQVQAAQAKNVLQAKMERAQEQLVAAQGRVVQAKARIARTTEIVRKLQAGITDESSTQSSDEAAGEVAVADSANSTPSKDNAAQQAATQKHSNALREAQDAERKANRAESRAATAQKSAEAREEVARSLVQKARDLRAQRARELRQQKSDEENQPAADEPLARSEASGASGGTAAEETPKSTPRPIRRVSVSQEIVEAARLRAQSATSQAASANAKAQTLATEAARARGVASTSSERAARLMSQLQLFGDDSPSPKSAVRRRKSNPRLRSVNRPTGLPSISQAARMVQAATEESAAAQSEARRLKAQVDRYSQQAQETRQNLDATSSALQASEQTSQQRSLDRTLVANLSVVRAPSSGTVLWVAPVADDVSSGEPIIRMGRRGALHARFADRSGMWRNLKPDMLLPARVSDAADLSEMPVSMRQPNNSSTRLPRANQENANASASTSSLTVNAGAVGGGISATARVESVTPPERAGEPAIIRVAVSSAPSQTSGAASAPTRRRRLRSGMTVSCLFPRPVQPGVSLPRTAILPGDMAPVLMASAPFPPDAQQFAVNAGRDDNALPTGSNNGALPHVVSGANNPVVPDAGNAAVGEKSANTAALGTNSASVSGNATTSTGWVAVLTPLDASRDVHRIEWRRVMLSAEQSTVQKIVNGLRPGERVALQPSSLWTYSKSYGADATIRLSRRL